MMRIEDLNIGDIVDVAEEGGSYEPCEVIELRMKDYTTPIALVRDEDGKEFELDNLHIFELVTNDVVNSPVHYKLLDGIEVKDVVAVVANRYEKGSVAHNVASAIEYLMRAPLKNGKEDVEKAIKCLEFATENWSDEK